MRKRIILLLFPLLLLSVRAFAQVIDKPAATVNLYTPVYISVSQLDDRVSQEEKALTQAGVAAPPDLKMKVLDAMVSEILISQAAENTKITVSKSELDDTVAKQKQAIEHQIGPLTAAQYHQVVERQTGLSWDSYLSKLKSQLIAQKYVLHEKGSMINGVPSPTEQQIDDFYSQNATSFTNPEIVRFSQIFFDTRNLTSSQQQQAKTLAESVDRKARNGDASWDQLVQQYTNDQRSRYTGGDAGYLERNSPAAQQFYGQGFMNEVFSLKKGQVSGVLETKTGFYIVKVTEHYAPKLLTLSDAISPTQPNTTVREWISQRLEAEEKAKAFSQAVKDIVANLKKQADITIYKQNID